MATKRKATRPAESSGAASGRDAGTTSLDVEALRQIVEILEASDVTRLVWTKGPEKLYIRRGHAPETTIVHHTAPSGPGVTVSPPVEYTAPVAPRAGPAAAAAAAPAPEKPAEKPGHQVTSPFVGTFYRTPAPDQPPFVDVGTVVRKGQVLCIVEAMKLMNEIESEVSGRIAEVLVENGRPVEFGQALFRIEPA
ncbi:acetyl-CoA carboxylase biotin carboxyl carrier protein [Corallococcus exiguus]|uniref:acetyl-CoA carboxylase biotin carboxyl carrier protein n=1 Tax=Corallococcus TaxID=83461 RepID=UPI000ED82B06|nr:MULTISPECIES: acetyl-CoA carboxylase biotin carboxyl carrier protein [Corallococcus]NNB90979.1 acetyl-CoA carboxylase biotin carboxyl carrier protein [Corallococcus exiguus]NNB99637.1 acetyl-CoA carboxylase biotin carboxyl carrier protein [Corallococcus exiguus]NNC04601.1 acetyl-CoA carboxylase biotin carboxyl carrier protein [Corallococcus exiguus]NPC52471.1 acetyl-CoA carboxylase biotin carboxyl carrier protein [Corallococcus exiguus]RKH74509.1 acetyl-CoA carboxylase biotin carboxyl carri